jgi:hypothetical protein
VKETVAFASGGIGEIVDASGKHEVVGQPWSFGVGMHPTEKPWGFDPAFASVKVTLARFSALRIAGAKAVSFTVT